MLLLQPTIHVNHANLDKRLPSENAEHLHVIVCAEHNLRRILTLL